MAKYSILIFLKQKNFIVLFMRKLAVPDRDNACGCPVDFNGISVLIKDFQN